MHFELTEEQALLRETIERFALDYCDPAHRAVHRACERGYSAENWHALAELGVLSLPFAAADGGLGGGRMELLTVMEGLGRALALEPVLEEIIIAGGLIARAGSAAQKDRWLPRLMSGEAHLSLAHIERGARYDLATVSVRARRSGSCHLLDGDKLIVPQGAAGSAFIVSALEDTGSDDRRVGLYLLEPDTSGLERRELRLVDGSVACTLALRGCPSERLPGGLAQLEAMADDARLAACAEMLGIMSRLLDATLEHVRTRKQFGAPLGAFQVIQHMLADLYASLEQSRSQLYRAALFAGEGAARREAIAGMKSYVSAAAVRLGEQCIQLHGGMGVSEELPIGDGHKRILLLSTLFGDADHELHRYIRSAALSTR